MEKPRLSVIIPVYNEVKSLPDLHAALTPLYADFPEAEVIFVDDGSKDHSLSVLRKIAADDPRVKVLSFHRKERIKHL